MSKGSAFGDADAHLARYAAELEDGGAIRSPAVGRAFRSVPRHVFIPADAETTLADHLGEVYADDALITGYGNDARFTSTSSQPSLMAQMLELLRLVRGTRVLEIGTGTGYNAALLGSIVGSSNVTTIEVDDELAERARQNLAAVGMAEISVLTRDAGAMPALGTRWDRVIATVGINDVPDWWCEGLTPGGFALVPLQHAGWDPLIELRSDGDRLRGNYVFNTAFMSPRGSLAQQAWWRNPREQAIAVTAARARRAETRTAPLGGVDCSTCVSRVAFWFYLTLTDRRAFSHPDGFGLADDTNYALSSADAGRHSDARMWEELAGHWDRWLALGAPDVSAYEATFVPSAVAADMHPAQPCWPIRRALHVEHVTLPLSAELG